MGAGVREGVIYDRPMDSTDLVPTIGSMLGFQASLSQGKPIAELVVDRCSPSNSNPSSSATTRRKRASSPSTTPPRSRNCRRVFVPSLLREVIEYDYKFPVERKAVEKELETITALSPSDRSEWFEGFAQIKLSQQLDQLRLGEFAGAIRRATFGASLGDASARCVSRRRDELRESPARRGASASRRRFRGSASASSARA